MVIKKTKRRIYTKKKSEFVGLLKMYNVKI